MAGLARGLGIAGAALLLTIPFIASAQEHPTPVDGSDPGSHADADADADDDDVARVTPDEADPGLERAGPPWYDGPEHTGPGKPPWAGGPGDKGPPPWTGRDAGDRPDGSGPPWFEGEREGPGRPPWAGGPKHAAERGVTTDGWRPGNGPPPWAGAEDGADD